MRLILWALRHGETEYNRQERLQGGCDSPLTEQGIGQAEQLGRALVRRVRRPDAWYVSPLGRTRQTSDLLRAAYEPGALPAEVVADELQEISCGSCEGQLRVEIDPAVLAGVRSDPAFRYPGGESANDLLKRSKLFLQRLTHETDQDRDVHVVAVSHGNLVRALIAQALGLGGEFVLRTELGNTGVCTVGRQRGSERAPWTLMGWNDQSHLGD